MAEVDTSSYPKPLPAQAPLQTLKDVQSLESGALTIEKQKFDNANQALGYLTRAMAALGPNASKEQQIQAGQQAVKLGLAPASALKVWVDKVTNASSPAALYNEFMSTAASHQELFNIHLGQQGYQDNGQTVTPIRTPGGVGGTPYATGRPIQSQQGVNVPSVDEAGRPRALGAQPTQYPEGMEQVPGGIPGQMRPSRLPVAAPAGPAASPPGPLPVGPIPGAAGPVGPGSAFGPPGTKVISAEVQPPTPKGAALGNPAMFEEGKKKLLEDQQLTTQIQTQIKPAVEALPLIKGLTTGMGTETVNKYLAGLHNLGWLPQGITDKVAAYQIVNKKLSQFVQGNGTRSDADLAKREESSPNVKGQINPALMKLAKDTIALQRVEAARGLSFTDASGNSQRSDLNNYPAHAAKFPASVDQRAFQLDLMDEAERNKLADKMYKEKDTYEGKKFWKSYQLAKQFIDTSSFGTK